MDSGCSSKFYRAGAANRAAPSRAVKKNDVQLFRHPAPLPKHVSKSKRSRGQNDIPPKPHLTIRHGYKNIELSWEMPYNLRKCVKISTYEVYAYLETSAPPSSSMWKKFSDANELQPTSTLVHIAAGDKYYFAVRAIYECERKGIFSDPIEILF